ncbi:MAG TPA: Gfo/Idh/MocA family oxidoreductase [Acidimicrobiales bacterium]|nr:Gfo/Idh/MocA family oxidoreductase [Acidimicrobiales bacterium]
MVRIGFCGAGLIAWAHALGLEAMIKAGVIEADVTVVHDRSERRAQALAGLCRAQVVGDLSELMAGCDAVWVCTPTAAHRAAVDEAITANRAIFCEKPLATDLGAAQSLVDAVHASGVAAQSGLVLRSAPVFRALRGLIASGELGQPMAALFRDDQYFPIQGTYGSKWRSDVTQAGGGCLIEHSIHDVDILRFCFGEAEAVSARTSNFAGHDGIEDMAAVSMRFESGTQAQLTSVWHNILSRGSTRRIEIFCQDGMIRLSDEFRGPLHIQTSTSKEVRPCPSPQWVDDLPLGDDEAGLAVRAYVEEDRAFIDAVTSGSPPEPSLGEALVAHRLVDAAYRSAAGDGAPVSLG